MKENGDISSGVINPITISKNHWIGFGFTFIASFAIAIFLWFQVEIDKSVLFALNHSNFSESTVLIIRSFSSYGMAAIAFIYLCYLVLSFKIDSLQDGKKIFLLIIFSFAIAGVSGDILKEILNRVRPFVEYSDVLSSLSDSDSPSFPSGHATKSVALVLPFLFFTDYKGLFHTIIKCVLAFIALMVCFARIFLGAHYLSDVIAGIGCAFLFLPVAVLITNKILSKMSRKKYELATRIWVFIYILLIFFLTII